MTSKLIAVVAGVGPGTGASVARKFAKSYPVILLARNPESYADIEKEINAAGGKAVGISADVTDEESVKRAFVEVEKQFGKDVGIAVSFLCVFGWYGCWTGLMDLGCGFQC
jgi:NAD(P)-dependent dehydrogenase (short-subunit alcohol dehydrogenase family)